jgi:uncharacterized protein (DUF1501 family)
MTTFDSSRRQLLRRLGAIGIGSAAAPWIANLAATATANAAGSGGYKALVCLFLYGGNDAYNTVLPTDANSWAAYLAARNCGDDPLALAPPNAQPNKGGGFNASLGGVLPITPRNAQGRTFALHPSLGAVRDLFAAGRVAIVPNVGPLITKTTKDQVPNGGVPLPPKLMSHNDQQSVWQSGGPEGATVGWGGAMTDLLGGNRNPIFTSISTGPAAVWLAGRQVRPYNLSLQGPIQIGATDGTLFSSAVAQQTLTQIMSTTRETQYFEQDHTAVVGRSMQAYSILGPAYPGAGAGPWGTPNLPAGALDPLLAYTAPSTGQTSLNPFSAQLQAVARMIACHSAIGANRQIFFVGLQGFDTHSAQNTRHADMLAAVAQAMSYWDNTTRAMGVDQNVTLFTASDFGRAFSSNGNGSDHGWGGHHFALGGGVNGGDLYGTFPQYGLSDGQGGFTSPDQLNDGVLLPSTPTDAYAFTLGHWLGLSVTQLAGLFPNLAANWNPGLWNLNFFKMA